MVRYYGLYVNAYRGKVRRAGRVPVALGMLSRRSCRATERPPPVHVFEQTALIAAEESGVYE